MALRIVVLLLLAGWGAGAAFSQPAGPWPMFRSDGAHTGRSPGAGPTSTSLRWQFPMEGRAYASPAVGPDGTVYAATFAALHAVSDDGALRWRTPIDGLVIASPAVGSNGLVYVGSSDGRLYAFQTTDGARRWTFEAGDEIWSSPTLGEDGTLYVGSTGGTLYAVEADGESRWAVPLGSELVSSPALGADGTVFIGSVGGDLHAVARDGTVRWTTRLGGELASSPALGADGTIYVGSTDGQLYAVSPEGAVRWSRPLGGEIISSPALGADGAVYVGSTDGQLYAVSAEGAPRWSTRLAGPIFSSPALDGRGRLYIGTTGNAAGTLAALDAATGSILWSLPTETSVWTSPALAGDGVLYAATEGLGARGGNLLKMESADFTVRFEAEPEVGTPQRVEISAPESFTPTSGTLFYRRGGERAYASLPLAGVGTSATYEAVIPADFVTERGLEYYVTLTDGVRTHTFPKHDAELQPASRQVRVGRAELPPLLAPRSYAMVSVPLELQDPDPAAVVADDYGSYDPFVWRLLRWRGDAFAEYPDLGAAFTPGTAFFLAHRTATPFAVEQARSVDTSRPYVVTLEPGWNQVGLPFAFPIDWNAVDVLDAAGRDAVREIAFYNGVEMIQQLDAINPLQPWQGYFLRNALDRPVAIAFPNREATPGGPGKYLAAGEEGLELQLTAVARASGRQDSQNWLGFAAGGEAGAASRRLVEAPAPAGALRLSILHEGTRYAAHYVPAGDSGYRWELELALDPAPERPEAVEITVRPDRPLPDGLELSAIDRDRNETIALFDGALRLQVGGDRPVRRLALVVGNPAFVEASLEGVAEHPAAYFLDQNYPNPFNPETTISFGLDRAEHVTLEVYAVTGQHVVTLVDGVRDAGRHVASWDGRNSAGERVASGLYLYRLRTASFSTTRHMLLLR